MASDSSSEEEDMSRFASVAVSSEFVTKAAQVLPVHRKASGNSAGRFGLRDGGVSLGIVENQLYEALASRLANNSDCHLDTHSDTATGGSKSDSDNRDDGGSNGAISQTGADASTTDQPSPFQIFRAAPKGQPITFVAAVCADAGSHDHSTSSDAAVVTEQQPLTRRERVHAMKQEARRQRKAIEKSAKAEVAAAKEAAAAKRRGEPQLPAPPPVQIDSEARALRVADMGSAHLRIADEPKEVPGEQPCGNLGRPQSLQEAADRGIEVTDAERKEFKRRWRIAKNERRKAQNAIGRAARQVKKAAHHQVKHNIKKEKQARRDRNAQRERDVASATAATATVVADPSGTLVPGAVAAKDSAVTQPRQLKTKGEALKTARKKISVKRGKFSKQRCEKRNKQLRRGKLTQIA